MITDDHGFAEFGKSELFIYFVTMSIDCADRFVDRRFGRDWLSTAKLLYTFSHLSIDVRQNANERPQLVEARPERPRFYGCHICARRWRQFRSVANCMSTWRRRLHRPCLPGSADELAAAARAFGGEVGDRLGRTARANFVAGLTAAMERETPRRARDSSPGRPLVPRISRLRISKWVKMHGSTNSPRNFVFTALEHIACQGLILMGFQPETGPGICAV